MSNMIEYEKLKNIASYPTGKLNSNAADENGKYPSDHYPLIADIILKK